MTSLRLLFLRKRLTESLNRWACKVILWLVGFQCAAEPYDHFSGVRATARRSVPPALSVVFGLYNVMQDEKILVFSKP